MVNMRNKIEKELIKIVAEITERDESEIWAKRDQNFFNDMGFESLIALEIIAEIEQN